MERVILWRQGEDPYCLSKYSSRFFGPCGHVHVRRVRKPRRNIKETSKKTITERNSYLFWYLLTLPCKLLKLQLHPIRTIISWCMNQIKNRELYSLLYISPWREQCFNQFRTLNRCLQLLAAPDGLPACLCCLQPLPPDPPLVIGWPMCSQRQNWALYCIVMAAYH